MEKTIIGFTFDCVHSLYCKCCKWILNEINYIKIPLIEWKEKKQQKILSIKKITLNHEEIGKHLERKTKVKPFVD